jgi:hypothetical protein
MSAYILLLSEHGYEEIKGVQIIIMCSKGIIIYSELIHAPCFRKNSATIIGLYIVLNSLKMTSLVRLICIQYVLYKLLLHGLGL